MESIELGKMKELKEEYISWLESIKIRRIAYLAAKKYLKETEEKLRSAKHIFNRTYQDWKEAREEAVRTKRRWKSYPYKMRQWAKSNFGKVMDTIEGEK
jgi:hypothetical protein